MILEYVHAAFQRGKLTMRMFMDLWRRETLIGLWQRDPAQGRRIDHMTAFLAQTAVASICTIYDLLLLSSSSSCGGKLLSAQTGQNGVMFGCKAINNNPELFIFPSLTLVCSFSTRDPSCTEIAFFLLYIPVSGHAC